MKLDPTRYQVGLCAKSDSSKEWVMVITDAKHTAMVGGLTLDEAKELHKLIGKRIRQMEKES